MPRGTYNGTITVQNGPLRLTNTGALANGGTVKLDGPATVNPTLDLRSNTASAFTTNVDVTASGQIFAGATTSGSGQLSVGNITLRSGSSLNANGSAGYTLAANSLSLAGNATVATTNVDLTVGSVSDTVVSQLTKGGAAGKTLTITGADTHRGATVITAGTLKLGSGATMASTSLVDVRSGTIFDVSALSGGYTLASTQGLSGAGKVVGNVAASGTVDPGTHGTVGTLTSAGDLALNQGSTTTFDFTSPGVMDILTEDAAGRTIT